MNRASSLLLLASESHQAGDKDSATILFYEALASEGIEETLDLLRTNVGQVPRKSMAQSISASAPNTEVDDLDINEVLDNAAVDPITGEKVVPTHFVNESTLELATTSPVGLK